MEMQENQLIARISKGTKMDQIYLPKNRTGMLAGEYVLINILTNPILNLKETEGINFKPYFYGLNKIEPIKLQIIKNIFDISTNFIEKEDKDANIIVTGSFLDGGFNFNDIDVLILSANVNIRGIERDISNKIGIKPHIIALTNDELVKGLASDPLYQTMISKCVSRNRLIFNFKPIVNVKMLDLHLLKSKALIDSFEILNGKEKYYLTFNLISIRLFLQHGRITKELVEKTIKHEFSIKTLEEIKENMIGKEFLGKYKDIYNKTFDLIMKKLKEKSKNESK